MYVVIIFYSPICLYSFCSYVKQVSERVVRRLKGEKDLPLKGSDEVSPGRLYSVFDYELNHIVS